MSKISKEAIIGNFEYIEDYVNQIKKINQDPKTLKLCMEILLYIQKEKATLGKEYSGVILPKKAGQGKGRIMMDKKGVREIPEKDADIVKLHPKDND